MNNLNYCTDATKKAVNNMLESPVTADWVKDIVIQGLDKDCVDVVAYLDDALKLLQRVRDDILYTAAYNKEKKL